MRSYEHGHKFRWSPLGMDHTKAWSDLSVAVSKSDGHRETFSPQDLREELSSPGFDPKQHSLALWHGERLIGASTIWVRHEPRFDGLGEVTIEMMVDPQYRGGDLEHSLLDRSEVLGERSATLLTPGLDYMVLVPDYSRQNWMADLLASRRYMLARFFHVMHRKRRSLEDAATRPHLDGIEVRSIALSDSEAIREAHNDAFRNHWGSGPASEERWAQTLTARSTRLDFSKVAVDEGGKVLSYALVGQFGPDELHVLLLGTRPQYWRQGLGRAVLSEVLRAADASPQISNVVIEVDSENASGAGDLYTSLGFETDLVQSMYQKYVEAPFTSIRSDRYPPRARN